MITKRLTVSVLLLAGFIAGPLNAQAGLWDVFGPLGFSKIMAKTKAEFGSFSIEKINQALMEENRANFGFNLIQNDSLMAISSPITPWTYKPKRAYVVAITGYSSTPDQTDHTPFITAAGTHVRDGVIAANFLPFGTVIKIPELFGDKTFIVEDRMASRYWFNIDIWFPERELAKEFGIKKVKIEIVS